MKQTIDRYYTNQPFKFEFYEGSNAKLILEIEDLGEAATDLSGHTARIYYYNEVTDTSSYQIDSDTTDDANGEFVFDVSPSELAEDGTYKAEVVILDAGDNPFMHSYGSVVIRRSILSAGTDLIASGPKVNYAIITSYSGVASHGPYRAGDNITFSTNADGSVDIDCAAAGSGATGSKVDLVSGQDFIVVSGLGLSSAPAAVVVTVHKPVTGNFNIFGTVVEDTLSTDGFRVELSATPDSADYKLSYIIAE